MSGEDWQSWFEAAWAFREETLYPRLFGSVGPGIYALGGDIFSKGFGQSTYDPRWLTEGVLESPPTANRPNWLYVSSGLSNAWEAPSPNPNGISGLGCEFILQCTEQAQWAIILLQRMVAFQILLNAGRFPGKDLLKEGDRIPLRAPINGADSELTSVLVTASPDFGGIQQIPSGRFEFLQFVGITQDEVEFAKANGSDSLFRQLMNAKVAPVTDPARNSIAPRNTQF